MPDYSVYKHIFPNGKIYIGMTCQSNLNRRWDSGRGYKTQSLMARAIEKYGWENVRHEIIANGLTKAQAEATEMAMIAENKTNNPQFGYNIENGGNCTGTHSEATKQKIGEAQRGEKNHMYGKKSPLKGKKMDAEAIEKNRLAHLGQTPWNKGKPMDAEQKAKLRKPKSKEHKMKLSEAKSVPVVCVETGERFKSGMEASTQMKINRGSISRATRNNSLTAGGYHWRFC